MIENSALRRNWRSNWLASIQEFADIETQRRLWLDPANSNPHYSFVEYLCCYFDDLVLADEGYRGVLAEGLISSEEVAAVSNFHEIADAYNSPTDDYDHAAILDDPNWKAVVEAAQQARATLLTLIDDPRERSLLTQT